jgi:low affinity Fe/Cu permease
MPPSAKAGPTMKQSIPCPATPPPRGSLFSRIACATARATGHPLTFGVGVLAVLVWAASGPMFGFSDTWQLVINTTTTIITFLMVFLIQHTQNRDSEAVQIKLDELIRALDSASNAAIDLETMDAEALERIRARYAELATEAREQLPDDDPLRTE